MNTKTLNDNDDENHNGNSSLAAIEPALAKQEGLMKQETDESGRRVVATATVRFGESNSELPERNANLQFRQS